VSGASGREEKKKEEKKKEEKKMEIQSYTPRMGLNWVLIHCRKFDADELSLISLDF
jgi:hypothetical protein